MKIYLTKNDVLEILASHFGLKTMNEGVLLDTGVYTIPEKGKLLKSSDEFYWEGNEEKG